MYEEDRPLIPRVLSYDDVAAACGKSRSWVERLAKSDPKFPRPRRIGKFSVGVFEHELSEYLYGLAKASDAPVHHGGKLHLKSATGKKSAAKRRRAA